MGCWNKTCGLTNLPIFEGEEVYVFPLMENGTDSSFCKSSALWKPVLTPFVAEYDDYGGGTNASGVALPLILAGIKEILVETEVGDNEVHDIAVKRDNFDIDLFFEATHERRLFAKEYGSMPPCEINYVMMRKDFVDDLWSNYKFDQYTGKGKGLDPTEDYDRDVTYAQLAETLPSFIESYFENKCWSDENLTDEEFVEKWVTDKTVDVEKIAKVKSILRTVDNGGFSDGIVLDQNSSHPLKNTFRRYGAGTELDIFRLRSKVSDAYAAGDTNRVLELLQLALVGNCIERFMDSTRKAWIPGLHEGSQGQDHDAYRFLVNGITKIIDEYEVEHH